MYIIFAAGAAALYVRILILQDMAGQGWIGSKPCLQIVSTSACWTSGATGRHWTDMLPTNETHKIITRTLSHVINHVVRFVLLSRSSYARLPP